MFNCWCPSVVSVRRWCCWIWPGAAAAATTLCESGEIQLCKPLTDGATSGRHCTARTQTVVQALHSHSEMISWQLWPALSDEMPVRFISASVYCSALASPHSGHRNMLHSLFTVNFAGHFRATQTLTFNSIWLPMQKKQYSLFCIFWDCLLHESCIFSMCNS